MNKRKKRSLTKTVGARVRKARLDAGFTPEYLAKILNMRERYILDIEENKIEAPIDLLYKIAVHCQTTVRELKPPNQKKSNKGYL